MVLLKRKVSVQFAGIMWYLGFVRGYCFQFLEHPLNVLTVWVLDDSQWYHQSGGDLVIGLDGGFPILTLIYGYPMAILWLSDLDAMAMVGPKVGPWPRKRCAHRRRVDLAPGRPRGESLSKHRGFSRVGIWGIWGILDFRIYRIFVGYMMSL